MASDSGERAGELNTNPVICGASQSKRSRGSISYRLADIFGYITSGSAHMNKGKGKRVEDDETIIAAILEGRHADDIYLLDCPWCRVPSYYNQGSHFTCRICERTVQVVDDDSGSATSVSADDMYSLADFWETAPYPCDERESGRG